MPEADSKLTNAELKLLCSLPGVEHSVVQIVEMLAAHISEAKDREVRLLKRVEELSMQLQDIQEELFSMKNYAIAEKGSRQGSAQPQPAQHGRRRSDSKKTPRSRTRTAADKPAGDDETAPGAGAPARPGSETRTRTVSRSASRSSGCSRTDDGDSSVSSNELLDARTFSSASVGQQFDHRRPNKLTAMTAADDGWQLVSAAPPRTRRSVVYVGNLSTTCTAESLQQFIGRRCQSLGLGDICVHNCSMHTAKESGRVSARLTVDASRLTSVTDTNFWPRPVYCRSWKFSDTTKGHTPQNTEQPSHLSSSEDAGDSASHTSSGDGDDTGSYGSSGDGVKCPCSPSQGEMTTFSVTPHGKSRGYEHLTPPAALPAAKCAIPNSS